MSTYHINPTTGNPNVCRAKEGNCPYGQAGMEHYSSADEARGAYEKLMAEPKGTWAARLMERHYRLHHYLNITKDFDDGLTTEAWRLIKERDGVAKQIREALVKPSLTPPAPVTPIKATFKTDTFPRGAVRDGIGNTIEALEKRPELARSLENASFAWLAMLETDELIAVQDYTNDSTTYGKAHEDFPALHRALEKAPTFPETTLYSGTSHEMKELVLSQVASGKIVVPRVISTSCNPGQVNGFMHKFLPDGSEGVGVVLEIEASKGAAVIGISHSAHEFEILLPPGTYEVLEEENDLLYSWGPDEKTGKPFGRTAERVFKLRQVVEP